MGLQGPGQSDLYTRAIWQGFPLLYQASSSDNMHSAGLDGVLRCRENLAARAICSNHQAWVEGAADQCLIDVLSRYFSILLQKPSVILTAAYLCVGIFWQVSRRKDWPLTAAISQAILHPNEELWPAVEIAQPSDRVRVKPCGMTRTVERPEDLTVRHRQGVWAFNHISISPFSFTIRPRCFAPLRRS